MAGPGLDDLQADFTNLMDAIGLNTNDPRRATNAVSADNPLTAGEVDYTAGAGTLDTTPGAVKGATPTTRPGVLGGLLARFKAFVAALAVLGVVSATGCSHVAAKQQDVIREGRALLRDRCADAVLDREWQVRRAEFLADADDIAPERS